MYARIPLAALGAVLVMLPGGAATAQTCPRQCAPELRQADGCCPVSPPPSVPPPVAAPSGSACAAIASSDPATCLATLDAEIARTALEAHRNTGYRGTVPDIIGHADAAGHVTPGLYQKDAAVAQAYDERLEVLVRRTTSPLWAALGRLRQASLFDDLRTALYVTVPPALEFVTPTQDALLQKIVNSSDPTLQAQANELRQAVKDGWMRKKLVELAAADEMMVRRYATALALASRYGLRHPQLVQAALRLTTLTDLLGEDRMREYVSATRDPNDGTGAGHLMYTPGMYTAMARPFEGTASLP